MPAATPLRVLYFTKSSGFEHANVKQVDGQPSSSAVVLQQLGAAHDFVFTFSKDGSRFSPEYLAGFDVILFFTSGNLLTAGTDRQPPLTPAGKQALLDAVAGGKGFVAVHSGTDTFHTGESNGGMTTDCNNRYRLHGADADPYIRMLGGEFINHGEQQVARATVVDPRFPGCADLGAAISCREEWYSLKEFPPDVHVLLVMQTDGMTGPDYQRPPYPLAWARQFGKGRVWANAMGHREDVWTSAPFQAMLAGGIAWAGGRVDAEVTPNLATAAPQANTLPPAR